MQQIRSRLVELGRPNVRIVAVSKTHPPEAITELLQSGHRDFGENRQNEARDKFPLVNMSGIKPDSLPIYHHLGPLQSGAARQIPGLFSWVHGASSLSGIESLAEAAKKYVNTDNARSMPDNGIIRYLIQVDFTDETTKVGGFAPGEVRQMDRFPESEGLVFAGFMTMGPNTDDPSQIEDVFFQMKELRDEIFPGGEISMGMSGDWELAVKAGSTMVRIGSQIFGHRNAGPWKPGD